MTLPALEPVWLESLNVWCLRVEGGRHGGSLLGMNVLWKLTDPKSDPDHRITIQGVLSFHGPTHFEMVDRFLFQSRAAAGNFAGEIELRCNEYELAEGNKKPRGR